MKALGKAGVFLCLMVGLTVWVAAVFSQQGALGASVQPLAGQGQQNARNEEHHSRQADRSIDTAGLTLNSISVPAPTASYTVNLPLVLGPCIPSAPGESDSTVDALTVCSGQTVSGQVNDDDWDDVYQIWTVAHQTLTISMNGTGVGGPGDADLFLFPPGTTDLDEDPWSARSISDSNSEFIQYTVKEEDVEGYWYIDVWDCCDDDGGTNYNVTVTLSGPGATGLEALDVPESDRLRERGRSKGSN
jgi:hypothetical protein